VKNDLGSQLYLVATFLNQTLDFRMRLLQIATFLNQVNLKNVTAF